jgi:hypothetical protein
MEITIVKSKLVDPKYGERPRYRVYDKAVTEDQVDKNHRVEFSWKKVCEVVTRYLLKGEPTTLKILELSKDIPDPDSIVNHASKSNEK